MELLKIVALGDATESKTTLVTQSYALLIEDTYQKQVVVDGQPYTVEIKDSSGRDEHRALLDQSIRDAEAFALVYSVTSRETFARIEKHYNRIISLKQDYYEEIPSATESLVRAGLVRRSSVHKTSPMIPIMIIGDNFDKVDKREVSRDEAIRLAERLECKFLETSTKTSVNVEMCFDTWENERLREEGKDVRKGRTLRNVLCCGE
ncbi:11547_t:CDS:2 [Acaulospora morrowiae]|uniref:11547_t:CDS:1 n=1 Tax=Acaulospora morrowiae TaxID=94023 RepID=A0A9N8YQ94_9GLOM|nr:11547_t:CDS:2 [Acaulospora morrowiae]